MTNAGQGLATHGLGLWLRRLQRYLKYDSGVFYGALFFFKGYYCIPLRF